MTDEQTATQPIEAQSYESTEETGTSDPGQAQATEQTAQSFLTQSEAEKTAPGEQESILRGEQAEEEAGKKGEEKTKETKPEARAPEEYADFSVPEGMKLEGQDLTDFKSFAKEQDLTQEQAQKVLDFAGPRIKAMVEQPYKAWKELTEQWWNQTREDPEMGGTKLEQSVKDAGQAFVSGESNPFFKTQAEVQAMREALKVTGAIHHPEVQRLFVRMGRMLAEPGHLTGKPAPHDRQQALLNSMYPTMNEGQ